LPHCHGLLHDDLVLATVLVPKIGHFISELGYECGVVGVYPCVLPVVYPSSIPRVQLYVYAPVVFLVVAQATSCDPLADGALGDPESAGRILDGETVYPASIPFVHSPMLDPSEATRKPLEAILAPHQGAAPTPKGR
jgi:hypothetical protein